MTFRLPRRTLEHWHPDDGPFDEWLSAWAAEGMVPEWGVTELTVLVNLREVRPVALIEKAWLDAHPGYGAKGP